MNLVYLRYFKRVAETKSYAAAARLEYVSTSAIFRAIRALEDELHVTLFETVNRQTILTDAGRAVLPTVMELLREQRKLESLAQVYTSTEQAQIRIGTMSNPNVDRYLVPLLSEFSARYPNTALQVQDCSTSVLREMLLNNELDLALLPIFGSSEGDELFDSIIVSHHELCPVVRADSPLAAKKALSLADIASEPLVVPVSFSPARDVVLSQLAAHGLRSPVIHSFSSYSLRLQYADRHGGITFAVRRFELPEGVKNLVKIPFAEEYRKPFQYAYGFLSLRTARNPAVESFQALLRASMPLG